MNDYNPYMYGAFSNGGFQQFEGYAYSNMTTSSTLPGEAPLKEEASPSHEGTPRARPPRTLTTIATDGPSSSLSSRKGKARKDGEEGARGQTSTKRNQEPAYRFSPYAFSDSSLNTEDDSSKRTPTTWRNNPVEFNRLVVASPNEAKTPSTGMNLRRAQDLTDCSRNGIPYAYPIPNALSTLPGHTDYKSSVSNRFGINGPLSLQRSQNPQAHSEGIGKYLLRKMGWTPGAGVGARPQGDTEPVANHLEHKLDKKGLGLNTPAHVMEGGGGGVAAKNVKLPVAYLNDICLDHSWNFPLYNLVEASGPPHAPVFKYTIFLNGMHFPGEAGTTKKLAKANAARACLQELKLVT